MCVHWPLFPVASPVPYIHLRFSQSGVDRRSAANGVCHSTIPLLFPQPIHNLPFRPPLDKHEWGDMVSTILVWEGADVLVGERLGAVGSRVGAELSACANGEC